MIMGSPVAGEAEAVILHKAFLGGNIEKLINQNNYNRHLSENANTGSGC